MSFDLMQIPVRSYADELILIDHIEMPTTDNAGRTVYRQSCFDRSAIRRVIYRQCGMIPIDDALVELILTALESYMKNMLKKMLELAHIRCDAGLDHKRFRVNNDIRVTFKFLETLDVAEAARAEGDNIEYACDKPPNRAIAQTNKVAMHAIGSRKQTSSDNSDSHKKFLMERMVKGKGSDDKQSNFDGTTNNQPTLCRPDLGYFDLANRTPTPKRITIKDVILYMQTRKRFQGSAFLHDVITGHY